MIPAEGPANEATPVASSDRATAALAAQYRDRARDMLRKMQAESLPHVREAYGRAAIRFLQLAETANVSARRRKAEPATSEAV